MARKEPLAFQCKGCRRRKLVLRLEFCFWERAWQRFKESRKSHHLHAQEPSDEDRYRGPA